MAVSLRIEYPQVMKMQFTATMEVSRDTTLPQIKELILKDFWEKFCTLYVPKIGVHGSVGDIVIKDKDFIIGTNAEFQERLQKTTAFSAIFRAHEK